MVTKSPAWSGRIFYGWVVVGGLFLMLAFASGARHSFGNSLKLIVDDLGIDRASLSLAFSLNMLLYGMAQPFVGRWVDVYGPRFVMAVSSVLLAAGFVGFSQATELWQIYLFYGVIVALGLAGMSTVTTAAVVAKWFVKRRGMALAIVSSGSMGGQFALIPLTMYLILLLDWPMTYILIAIPFILFALPVALWVVKGKPEDVGLHPDGAGEGWAALSVPSVGHHGVGSGGGGDGERTPLSCAMRTRPFWLLGGGFFTCGFTVSMLAAHFVALATDRGFTEMIAATTLGLKGLASLVGVIAMGIASDQIGRKNILAGVYLLRAIGLMLFFVVETPLQLYLVAVVVGLGMSGTSAMTSALVGDIYGRMSVGTIFSWTYLSHQIGAALGSYLAGLAFVIYGSYFPAFALGSATLVVAAVLSYVIPEPRRRAVPMPEPAIGSRV